jgi:magnesium-transporting ATPase (P-type)
MINPRTKQSWLLKRMDSFLNLLFIFYLLLIIGLWIGHIVLESRSPFVSYLNKTTKGKIGSKMSVLEIIEIFFYFFIMFSHIIPISIYVAIEILKFLQTKRIDPPTGKKNQVENRIRV